MSSENDDLPAQPSANGLPEQGPPSFLPGILEKLKLGQQRPGPLSIDELLTDLKQPEWHVRAAAVRELGELGELAPQGALLAALDDPHVSVRANAALALGALGKHAPIEHLTRILLGDGEWQVRESAALALLRVDADVPEEPLLAATHDPDLAVRLAVQQVLQQRQARWASASRSTVQEEQTSVLDLLSAAGQQDVLAAPEQEKNLSLSFEKEKYMQENYTVNEITGFTDKKRSQLESTSKPGRTSWRVIGLGIAAAVVIVNLVAWSLLAHTLRGGTRTGSGPQGGNPPVSASSPTPAATRSALGSVGKTLYVYTPSYMDDFANLSSLGWSSDGAYISVTDLNVTLLNAANGHVAETFGSPNSTVWASWAPDGKKLVVSGHIVQICNARTGQVLVTFTPQSAQASVAGPHGNPLVRLSGGDMIYSSAWSPNGRLIASAIDGVTYGYDVQIWNPATGAYIRTLQITANATASDYISQVVWSPDGKYLAADSPSTGVVVWNTTTWQRVATLAGNDGIAWAPQGDILASANGALVTVWQAATGKALYTFQGQASNQSVSALAWAPDGKNLAIGGQDVRIWNVAAHKVVYTYTGFGTHTSFEINGLAWAPDSIRLASMDTGIDSSTPHTGTPIDSVRVWIAA